jgi:hypothetical protein
VTATVTFHKRRELALEAIVGRFSKADGVTRAAWRLNPLDLIALSGKVRLSKACRRRGEAACANLSGRDREGRLTGGSPATAVNFRCAYVILRRA